MKLDIAEEPVRIEAEVKTPAKSEFKLIGQLRPKRGHTVWEINIEARTICEAEFEKQDIDFHAISSGQTIRKRILRKPGCVYISALNKKNAWKIIDRV